MSQKTLIDHLHETFLEETKAQNRELTTTELELLAQWQASAKRVLQELNPAGTSYDGRGISLRLADGTDLALVPATETEAVAVDGSYGITGMGSRGRGGPIVGGDYPITGQREPRHEQMTRQKT